MLEFKNVLLGIVKEIGYIILLLLALLFMTSFM